jgi:ABC-type multidrug transport system fused ATPase/permease subunit
MTDEDDRRGKTERRSPSEKDETAMPRRARDSGRVRKAIRTELEEVAEDTAERQPGGDGKPSRQPQRKVISLENISLSFDEPILQDVSFVAKEGETIVVVGESGTGKSTILKLVLRLLVPDKGRVAIDGEDITHL